MPSAKLSTPLSRMIEKISSIISSQIGVVQVIRLSGEDRDIILSMEHDYETSQTVKLVNSGVRSVLKRDTVLAVLKDTTFRKPPAPTVLMVEEITENDKVEDNISVLDGRLYRTVGEEIFSNSISLEEEHIFISSGFVLFTSRRENREHIPSYFLMPSIEFPELEKIKNSLNIDNIISASPSSLSDDYIRKKHNLSKDNQLATILIGFDIIIS